MFCRSKTLDVLDVQNTHIWWIKTPLHLILHGLRRALRTASSSNRRQGVSEMCLTGRQCIRGRHNPVINARRANSAQTRTFLNSPAPHHPCFTCKCWRNFIKPSLLHLDCVHLDNVYRILLHVYRILTL